MQATKTIEEAIEIRGARTHNLKDVSCRLPHNKLTVITLNPKLRIHLPTLMHQVYVGDSVVV